MLAESSLILWERIYIFKFIFELEKVRMLIIFVDDKKAEQSTQTILIEQVAEPK